MAEHWLLVATLKDIKGVRTYPKPYTKKSLSKTLNALFHDTLGFKLTVHVLQSGNKNKLQKGHSTDGTST